MSKVKICGISRLEDVNYLNELHPDYAGFLFAESKRQVTFEKAKFLISNLDKNIKKVGVFVDEDITKVKNYAESLNLDIIQFHGKEDEAYLQCFKGYNVWKAIKIIDRESLKEFKRYNCEKYLLDNSIAGSGQNFDWSIIDKTNIGQSIILAGGLNYQNVEAGIKRFNPFAVDVSSGVEVNGQKDFHKIKEFIEKVRETI